MAAGDPANVKTERWWFGHIIPGGSADRGGLIANTVVHAVNGSSTKNLGNDQLLDLLRGPLGSEVTLTISDPPSSDQRQVILKRDFVRIDSIEAKGKKLVQGSTLKNSGFDPIGWINFRDLTASTLHELRKAEARFRKEKLRVLILDFSRCAGLDNLHQATLVADAFLDGNTIWQFRERNSLCQAVEADRECLFRDVPIVVIVSEHTGSLATAVAAALQDAGRATIVGKVPKFDGMISKNFPLKDSPFVVSINSIELTRSRSDRSWPLIPDHLLKPVLTFGNDTRLKDFAERQHVMRVQPKSLVPQVESADQVAERVATELLKTVTP